MRHVLTASAFTVLISLSCVDVLAPSRMETPLLAAEHAALVALQAATTFEATHVGYAGTVSGNMIAWQRLAASPSAAKLFRNLFATGHTPAGRLYALVGLYRFDRVAFNSSVADWQWQHATVETLFGCIAGPLPATALIEQVSTGEWTAAFLRGRMPDLAIIPASDGAI